MQALLRKIRQILKDRRTRRFFTRFVASVAAIVVFVTTYALILPAITLEKTAVCGVEEHQHSDSCYEEELVCGQEESDGHHHAEGCYSVTRELVCEEQEHQHSSENGCYDADGNLMCELQEHVHDDSCYEEVRTLTCGLKESEGHHHTDDCYEKVLVCGKEVHTHSEKCYEEGGSTDADTGADAGNTSDGMPSDQSDTGETAPAVYVPDATTEETQPDSYVPELDPLDMEAVLNGHTDFYYFHAEEGEEVPADSAEIREWKKVGDGTKLESTDLVKAYFAYTIPAGSLNETNATARYRMPGNLHLSDQQIDAMNRYENGIAAGYRDSDAASENYHKYLGAEAIEGDRRPDEQPGNGAQEYISAVVRAENVYGDNGKYLGQDLIFTFVPYSIEKNRNTYDADQTLVSAGEKITGWFACDFRLDQIDWESETETANASIENTENAAGENITEENQTAKVIFAEEDQKKGIKEIIRTLRLSGQDTNGESDEAQAETSEDTGEDVEDENDQIFESGSLTAERDDYKIILDYSKEAKIPENASLSVREITAETDKEAYEACLAQAGQQVAADDQTSVDQKASRFFDIEILATETDSDGTEKTVKIEPAAPVSVNIQINDTPAVQENKSEQSEPTVLHFAEEGVEQIDSTASTDSAKENNSEGTNTEISFEAESFSIYGVVYTVDFHWEVNGKTYDFSLPGGGFVSLSDLVEVLGITSDTNSAENDTANPGNDTETAPLTLNDVVASEETRKFVADVEKVEFSSPELVWIGKVDSDSTVGGLKEANELECRYSAVLTKEQIEEINAQTVEAGDWALISMQPFESEETLTVTMKNGDQFVIKVTDDRVTNMANIDGNKGYILYTLINGNYYVLKTDGSTVTTTNVSHLDTMGNEYKWNIKFVYTDQGTGISYYMIKPCDDNSKSIDLGWDTTFPWDSPNNRPLVAQDNCNVTFTPSGNGFKIEGYNNTKLVIENGWFAGRRGNSYSEIVIYDQDELSQHKYTVLSDDYGMGKVCGTNDQNQYKEDAEFDAFTNDNKYNAHEIKAVPQTARYIFDYWDLNGEQLNLGATIPAGTLAIPYQGSRLTAHFKKDPNYQAPDEEKEGRVIDKDSFRAWLEELRERNIPLNQDGCTKTAEVYDYENRIYRVDLTAQSNLSMFDGDIDLGFIIDVSGSMQFPSKLEPIQGYESIDVLHLNDNWMTQNSIDKNRTYFFVVDRTNTANVIYLKWGHWPTGNPNSSSTRWYDGWGISGYGYESDEVVEASVRYYDSSGHALFGGDNGPFQLYTAGDNGKRRREYLESSIAGTISELNSILGDLAYAQNASEAADVKIAYNTFANDVDYNHTNHNFVSVTSGLSIGYDYKGGTDTEEALNDARDFFWNDSATKVAVLITDGAPQQDGATGPELDARVKAAADALKNEEGVKLITIGLSMGDVKRGSRLLYDIATKDSDGDPYFYKADTGDELQYALYEVIQQVMADAIVVGDVTDTVNEAFYPVDKETGAPLVAGNVINLEGIKIANSISGLTDEQKEAGYGVIGLDNDGNYTVTWDGQNFTWDGWHGTVYEKAKEDLLGGNAVRTNDPEKPATIVSEGYKIHPEDPTIAFKPAITEQGTKSLETPRVNVNELDLTDTTTEWTVYLGTDVDPKSQLEAFYDNILVKEVVKAAADTDGDGFPDRMTGTNLYYPLLESISDERESEAVGEQVTFKMKDLLKKLNNGTEITIDDLINAGTDGITLPYNLYGQDCPGTINIKLTKTGDTADYEPHTTTVTGDAVETYKLFVDYKPDYEHLPEGQGGDGSKPYHTGTYSLAYQGHAAGEDYSTNTHIINVYNVPLDVYKTDETDRPLSGAVFKLYKAGGSGHISGLSGQYTEVASGTSGTDGVAHLTFAEGMGTGLVPGTTYYLVEDESPQNYSKVNTVWTVQVQTEIGKFTNSDGVQIYAPNYPTLDESMYPFNWDQGARIVVDGQAVKVVAKGEAENTTTTITDGSYVSHKAAISFRHAVQNVRDDLEITVDKDWEDDNYPNRPSSITVKLYRVSEKGHQWENGAIVPCTCTEDGVKEYTCSECGEKDTHAITSSGHKQGAPHRENDQAPTCTEPGGYDTVVRCTVCNAIISSEHTEIPATGHTWVNQETETSDSEHYCYDVADVCSVCGTVNEETRVHHAHDWGAWEVTTPAQPGVAGEETRICKHDPGHIDHREIPALSTDHTVTIYFRCTGDGNGHTYYPGQVTSIATRSGTGSGDMTIKWNWDQWTSPKTFDVSGLGSSTYTTSSSGNYNGAEQTLTISNITTDLTLYVTIRNGGHKGTSDGLIGQPSFAGNRSNAASNLNTASPALSRSSSGKSLLNAKSTPKREGKGAATVPAVLSGISGLKSKAEASCGDIYWEEVSDTYEITAADNWTLSIPDLDRFNENGKEYRYYVEEINPSSGYKVTYSGQGAQQDDTVTVTNEMTQGSLLITKNVQYNGRTAATDEEKALVNGSYAFTVKMDGVEITGSPFTINVTNGVSNSILIPNLEAGDYTIEETDSGNLTLKSAEGGKSVSNNIITVTVTAGKLTEADLIDTAKAEFTNNYIAYEVIVVKVDTENTKTKLGGAKFDLYSAEAVENGEIKPGAVPLQSNLVSSSDEQDKGKVSLGLLTPGTYYLFETEAPSGYNTMDMPVEIVVRENGVSLMQGSRNQVEEISQEKAELMVMNSAGAELPSTGGHGTKRLYLLGITLLGLAGAGYVLKWRCKAS